MTVASSPKLNGSRYINLFIIGFFRIIIIFCVQHQSYKASLRSVHLPSPLSRPSPEDTQLEDTDSHFHAALAHWRQLNLSPSFLRFADRVEGLAGSMGLLLFHWSEVVDAWVEAVRGDGGEGLAVFLELVWVLFFLLLLG